MEKIGTILVVGCGGIGSHFITNLVNEFIREQINFDKLVIYDKDKLELKNKLYTTFACTPDQIGKYKVEVLKEELLFVLSLSEKKLSIEVFPEYYNIQNFPKLEKNTLFVSTVDGSKFRNQLYALTNVKTLKDKNIRWIDIRSTGARYVLFSSPNTADESDRLYPYFEDAKVENASCQIKSDLDSGRVQYGNRIAALIGMQYLVNLYRKMENKLIHEDDFTGFGSNTKSR